MARLSPAALFVRLDRPGPHGSAAEVRTLAAAVRRFLAHPRPPVLLGCVGGLAAVRAARGPWRARDTRIAVAAAVAQPFVEWGVHRLVLHARPASRLGAVGYQLAGYGHEQHHRDPADLDTMFLRPREVITGTAAAALPGAARTALGGDRGVSACSPTTGRTSSSTLGSHRGRRTTGGSGAAIACTTTATSATGLA